jgi:hypothetical protein
MRNAMRLLEWCKAHHYWTLEQWKHILWNDKSRFNIWHSDESGFGGCQENATFPNA